METFESGWVNIPPLLLKMPSACVTNWEKLELMRQKRSTLEFSRKVKAWDYSASTHSLCHNLSVFLVHAACYIGNDSRAFNFVGDL